MIKLKRFIVGVFVIALIIGGAWYVPKTGLAATVYKIWFPDSLTDGAATSLDGIHSSTSGLPNNAMAISMLSGTSLVQFWKYDSGATGSNNTTTHPYTVIPADLPTTGLWTEQAGVSPWAGAPL